MTESLFSDLEHSTPDAHGLYLAHSDGGSRGNPGPAGFGAVIKDPRGHVVARLSEYLGNTTNNCAEYAGLIAVLKWADVNGVRRLRVVSDSELLVNQINGRYRVANPGLRPLWEEAKRLAGQLEHFEIGHTLRANNKEADQLANQAMDRGMGQKNSRERSAPTEASSEKPFPKPAREVFQGLVKNGVVHLIEGELPDGILVKVIRE
jgi:ribonuclease HI